MTIPLTEQYRRARHNRATAYWCVVLAMYLSLALGTALQPAEWLHYGALMVHLGSVIVGLGAAVLLELWGLAWARGRSSLDDLRRIEPSVSSLAWLGIIGLLASGAFLEPNLDDPLTDLKMLAVLIVALNGVAMTRLTRELGRLPGGIAFARIPPRLRTWCVWSALVSQAGWWTAVLVGMLNTASH
ncbi:hypothetical protein ASD65_13465 [Microbacterium sp. Root61]|uniref:hypothetical protein n=1 Tax=Microbacterium sp. Root61 TaxID=1736570 RepID=UPI0006F8614C|nr:hypothetical protein [Microbacterium sp. Root61]KRA25317.1 hypothetical protein ASD65_13465 [Microbacterium sp. Root61]